MVVLPFAVDGLFAFLRVRTEHVPEGLRERLRAVVEQGSGAAGPEATATAPDGEAPATGLRGWVDRHI